MTDVLKTTGLDVNKKQESTQITTLCATEPQTPEELCWCFAAGDVESRHTEGTIDEALYARLNTHMLAGTYPSAADVRAAFPHPFACITKAGEMVTLQSMHTYWQTLGMREHTPVQFGIVRYVRKKSEQQFVQLWGGSRMYHNHLRAPLKQGSFVWVYGTVATNVKLNT